MVWSCQTKADSDRLSEEQPDVIELGPQAILFIGNSHTFYNEGIAKHLLEFRRYDDPASLPIIHEVARGGYSLEDHLNDPSSLSKLMEREWDYVIFQENTTVAAETRDSTTEALVGLSESIAQKETDILLFMTWPYKDRPEMLRGIEETYEKAAAAINATIVPVGKEWMALDNGTLMEVDLYNADGIHASLSGTFYASALFYKAIYDSVPAQNGYSAGLPSEIANYLLSRSE